jgi:hypothetical protein
MSEVVIVEKKHLTKLRQAALAKNNKSATLREALDAVEDSV